jgi:uncharacterized membrane protein
VRLHSILLAAGTLCYPAIIYFLLRDHGVQALALPLCLLALLRVIFKREWWWGLMLLALAVATLLTGLSLPVKVYPVAVNMGLLAVFAQSLFKPPSIAERIARLREPLLPPAAVVYTRHVTLVWCAFFVINGGIAAWLALAGTDAEWAMYCGGIAYVLAGLLFASEYLVRQYVRRKWCNV